LKKNGGFDCYSKPPLSYQYFVLAQGYSAATTTVFLFPVGEVIITFAFVI